MANTPRIAHSLAPTTQRTTTRRRWLQVVLPTAFGLGALACKKEELACDDSSGLQPADAEARKALEYKERADTPERACKNCAQYVEPEGSGCATCHIMKGPIHPDGSCKVFSPKS